MSEAPGVTPEARGKGSRSPGDGPADGVRSSRPEVTSPTARSRPTATPAPAAGARAAPVRCRRHLAADRIAWPDAIPVGFVCSTSPGRRDRCSRSRTHAAIGPRPTKPRPTRPRPTRRCAAANYERHAGDVRRVSLEPREHRRGHDSWSGHETSRRRSRTDGTTRIQAAVSTHPRL